MTTSLAPPEPRAGAGDDPAPPPAAASPEGPRPRRPIAAVGAVAAGTIAVLVAGFLAAGLLWGDSAEVTAGKPQIVSVEELNAYAAETGRPVYWAGPPAAGFKLELTEVRGGSTFVRYLTQDAPAGDRRPNFTTVGTYPSQDAYTRTKAARDRKGAQALDRGADGFLLWYDKAPANVYVAKPGDATPLIEVYSPRPSAAQQLAKSDQIAPVR